MEITNQVWVSAISEDFIEAQGGKIWVESAVREGSKFCFSLQAERNLRTYNYNCSLNLFLKYLISPFAYICP
jgi:hypothetical protein